jgi:hypothetical protein
MVVIMAAASGAAVAARHHAPVRHHVRPNPPRHLVLSMSAADIAAPIPVVGVGSPATDHLHLAVDRRLGGSRWIGSLGYHPGEPAQALDPHAVNSAASVQLGQPDSTVGAKVSLPF